MQVLFSAMIGAMSLGQVRYRAYRVKYWTALMVSLVCFQRSLASAGYEALLSAALRFRARRHDASLSLTSLLSTEQATPNLSAIGAAQPAEVPAFR